MVPLRDLQAPRRHGVSQRSSRQASHRRCRAKAAGRPAPAGPRPGRRDATTTHRPVRIRRGGVPRRAGYATSAIDRDPACPRGRRGNAAVVAEPATSSRSPFPSRRSSWWAERYDRVPRPGNALSRSVWSPPAPRTARSSLAPRVVSPGRSERWHFRCRPAPRSDPQGVPEYLLAGRGLLPGPPGTVLHHGLRRSRRRGEHRDVTKVTSQVKRGHLLRNGVPPR